MEEIVFLNGKLLPLREASIPVSEPGFLLGWGVFETMRLYNNRIVYFNQHLERIKQACKLMQLKFPYSLSRLKDAVKRTIKINNFKDAYVRLTLWKAKEGTGALVIVRKYRPYPLQKYKNGFSAEISKFRQNDSFPAQIKTTSRLLQELSYLEAKNKGFDEAVVLNNRGYVTEGSRSNIFLIKQNMVFTPFLSSACLSGITRSVIFALGKKYKLKIYEANFTPQDLAVATEAFLTNSLLGVMPLTSLEKKPIAKGVVGRLTKFFMHKYNHLLKHGT